jgi:hypothetical protein
VEWAALLGAPQSPEAAVTAPRRKIRCAIYTRKSSEEGLEMEFNSLDAQREAALAGFTDQVQHVRFSRKASAGVLKPRDFLGVELTAQVRSSMSRAV